MITSNKTLIFKGGVVMQNMASENVSRIPEAENINVAHSVLSRDFKGLSNWNANGVIEIWKLK